MNNLKKSYAIVALSNDNVMAIPCIWLVQKNYSPIIKNKYYELYSLIMNLLKFFIIFVLLKKCPVADCSNLYFSNENTMLMHLNQKRNE